MLGTKKQTHKTSERQQTIRTQYAPILRETAEVQTVQSIIVA